MAAGKRRTAREIAVQMLYQRDLGGSTLPQIFAGFDLAEYLASERADSEDSSDENGSSASEKAPAGRAISPKRRRQVEAAFSYAQTIVQGVADHLEELDELIRSRADNWRLERMPPVDRNILRLAVFEMLYEKDIPKLVVVDEAIELAKKYGSEQSSRFVNGLLDGLLKTHSFPGSLK
ncbi:MAG TPA: transcription antitermination factor NusB [Thermoanaerobaculia bacterium]|nr:transcription antitermination factor NusB [Thermoanaerobaculia bacterium]